MLEKATSEEVNRLIRGMTKYCVQTFEKGETVDSDDLNALANLIDAVNSSEQSDLTPAIGFLVESAKEDDDDEER